MYHGKSLSSGFALTLWVLKKYLVPLEDVYNVNCLLKFGVSMYVFSKFIAHLLFDACMKIWRRIENKTKLLSSECTIPCGVIQMVPVMSKVLSWRTIHFHVFLIHLIILRGTCGARDAYYFSGTPDLTFLKKVHSV